MAIPRISLPSTKSTPHILVMDESQEVLALLHEVLAEEGFSLTMSSYLLDLQQIRACAPALIIMERRFDNLLAASWDVVCRTRQDHDLAQVPIVLSTTHRSLRMSALVEQDLRELGVHVLLKPYAIDDLLDTIQVCLNQVAAGEAEGGRLHPCGRNQQPAPIGSTASSREIRVRALLFPDGRVVIYDDPLRQLAKWHMLGRIRQDGEVLSFLRIDAAGASWTALVPASSLEQETMPLSVPLLRQADRHLEPLTGWPLFC